MGCSNTIYKSSRLTNRAIKFSASYFAMTSAYGPKLPTRNVRYSVAVRGKADVTRTSRFDCDWASPLAPPPPGSRSLSVLPRRPAFPET